MDAVTEAGGFPDANDRATTTPTLGNSYRRAKTGAGRAAGAACRRSIRSAGGPTYNCAMSTRRESRSLDSESSQGRNPELQRGRGARSAGQARSWSAGGRGARLLAEAAWIAGTLIAVAM